MRKIEFNDQTIQTLFGFEDAESEPIERLKDYYLKTNLFARVTADLPIRILVGHKGTGKSALFKIAISEEKKKGNLPILIRPDDVAELENDNENFLLQIRRWKFGLIKIIGEKVLSEFYLYDEKTAIKPAQSRLKLVPYIANFLAEEKTKFSETQKVLIENFLKKKKIVVFIDDLDRGWEGKKEDIVRISSLLNAIRDLTNENTGLLLFKVSLRSDLYYLIRTSDESSDKIEGAVIWCKWTNHEILVLLIKRILTYLGEDVDETILMNTDQFHLRTYLNVIMESTFHGRGKWENVYIYKVLMSLTRKRPRDLVKLCILAARQAESKKSSIIKTEHFQTIFEEYSQGRIQDTINEYKSELPDIDKLLFGMKPTKKTIDDRDGYIYTTPELMEKLNEIKQHTAFRFKNSHNLATEKELAQFLYKINFLTAREAFKNGEVQRKYFEENCYLSSSLVDFGYEWEVHPAFRWVLQPEDTNDIFQKLSLSQD
jgi:hypothetical protein